MLEFYAETMMLMKRTLAAGVLLTLTLLAAGCETMKGVGRDITNTGEAVQRSLSRK